MHWPSLVIYVRNKSVYDMKLFPEKFPLFLFSVENHQNRHQVKTPECLMLPASDSHNTIMTSSLWRRWCVVNPAGKKEIFHCKIRILPSSYFPWGLMMSFHQLGLENIFFYKSFSPFFSFFIFVANWNGSYQLAYMELRIKCWHLYWSQTITIHFAGIFKAPVMKTPWSQTTDGWQGLALWRAATAILKGCTCLLIPQFFWTLF